MRLFQLEQYLAKLEANRDSDLRFCQLLEALMEGLFLKDENYPCHSIESRPKSLLSAREKIQRKGYENPDEEMVDLIGLRIIMYYDSHVDYVVGVLRRELTVVEEHTEDKRSAGGGKPDGYRSYHVVARLNGTRATLPEWGDFPNRLFEIQVRSILAHAWAAIDHSMEYKRAGKISPASKALLRTIASNLREADERFNELRDLEDMNRSAGALNPVSERYWWETER
ncbi:MAG: hypothetical protein QM692_22355 [Thermomicrobiales bacterium]